MEKLSPNRAQLFLRNKYTVFTMGGTVALRSVNNIFSGELQFCSYFGCCCHFQLFIFFSGTTLCFPAKLDTKHPRVMRIQVCSDEWPHFLKGDQSNGPFQPIKSILWWKGFACSNISQESKWLHWLPGTLAVFLIQSTVTDINLLSFNIHC